MNWEQSFESLHKAIKTKQQGQTTARQLAGEYVEFWAGFNEQNMDKLELLLESIVYDLRQRPEIEHKDELMIRFGFSMLQKSIELCNLELKHKDKVDEHKRKMHTHKPLGRKDI